MSPFRLIVVDDDEEIRRSLIPHLTELGYEVLGLDSAESTLNQVEGFGPDLILTDVQMSGMNGFELLARLRELRPDIDVVIFTGYADVQGAIDAIKDGAYDYLLKPLDLDEIEAVIERCVGDRRTKGSAEPLREPPTDPPGGLVGRHPSMIEVYKTIGAVAASRAAVLIQGETGTGKELIARTIHGNSPESSSPFIAVNCAAVPESLLESELFGHVRGAFTGASADRRGPFELAGSGTIFLDEIGDTSLSLQSKLLRVLEEREFYPVGSESIRRTEARIIAATNRPLEGMVQSGAFREDLYFRLRVIELRVPSLRERRSDIHLLVRHHLSKAAAEINRPVPAVPPEVMAELASRDWPGNVRELENVLTRAVVMCRGGALSKHDISEDPLDVERTTREPPGGTWRSEEREGSGDSLASVERKHVQEILLRTGGNKSAAARILNISRPTLNRMIKEYELYLP
ncbi:sigma-54-dependent transcriptional regulator [Gemmatimonadota bacterium]